VREIWEGEATSGAPGALAAVLRLLSCPYGAAVAVRNGLYDRGIIRKEKLPRPVISVGNITVGGTGKTPTVIYLANLLRAKGRRPAVLSRGYGGRAKAPVNVVSDGNRILMDWRAAGDEPVLIAEAAPDVPVLTGPKRILTGRTAIGKFGADCLILDDAFQHQALFRDLDICLLDAARPFGNGFLLPRGPLREPPDSLRRADIILRTRSEGKEEPPRDLPTSLGRADMLIGTGAAEGPDAPPALPSSLPTFRGIRRPQDLVEAGTGRIRPLEALRGEKVCAFAGIAHPEAFERSLAELGAEVAAFRAFPDHHPYGRADAEEIRRLAAAAGAGMVLTTAKDAVRLHDIPDFRAEVSLLRIRMEIEFAGAFAELIFSRIAY